MVSRKDGLEASTIGSLTAYSRALCAARTWFGKHANGIGDPKSNSKRKRAYVITAGCRRIALLDFRVFLAKPLDRDSWTSQAASRHFTALSNGHSVIGARYIA